MKMDVNCPTRGITTAQPAPTCSTYTPILYRYLYILTVNQQIYISIIFCQQSCLRIPIVE